VWRFANYVFDTLTVLEFAGGYVVGKDTFMKDAISNTNWNIVPGNCSFTSRSVRLDEKLEAFLEPVSVKHPIYFPNVWVQSFLKTRKGQIDAKRLPCRMQGHMGSVGADSIHYLVQEVDFDEDGVNEALLTMHGKRHITFGYLFRKNANNWLLEAVLPQSSRGIPIDSFTILPREKIIYYYDRGWGTCYGSGSLAVHKYVNGRWKLALHVPAWEWSCGLSYFSSQDNIESMLCTINSDTIRMSYSYLLQVDDHQSDAESLERVFQSPVFDARWNWSVEKEKYVFCKGSEFVQLLLTAEDPVLACFTYYEKELRRTAKNDSSKTGRLLRDFFTAAGRPAAE